MQKFKKKGIVSIPTLFFIVNNAATPAMQSFKGARYHALLNIFWYCKQNEIVIDISLQLQCLNLVNLVSNLAAFFYTTHLLSQ